ncbi:MAG: hypothetical protein P1U44_13050 [Vicingaceae bacterium]|nr:hypothetical protein [Vicingaceae bacterium]
MKNTNYTLEDLFEFWKGQQKLNFQGIKVLIEIYENGRILKHRKRWIILAGLRGLGLYEVGYQKTTIDEILKEDTDKKIDVKNDIPGEIEWDNKHKGVQFFKCNLIDGTYEFWKILN